MNVDCYNNFMAWVDSQDFQNEVVGKPANDTINRYLNSAPQTCTVDEFVALLHAECDLVLVPKRIGGRVVHTFEYE